METKKLLKYLFIVNRGSGSNKNDPWEQTIREAFADTDPPIDIFILPKNFNKTIIQKHINEKQPTHVVAVGGDGTVNMLAKILAGSDLILGILPGGSANGMAKELGIPEDPQQALNVLKAGNILSCDLIRINDAEMCLHLSDLGLNAQLIKYFDQGKLRGKFGYARVILKTLWHKRKMQVIVRTKDDTVNREAFMVVLANARMYGTGAVINPAGAPNDGTFEVIIVRKLRFGALLRMLIKPGMFNPKNIEIFSCTQAEIKISRHMHFQVDGEYLGKIKTLTAVVQPGAVKVIFGKTEK